MKITNVEAIPFRIPLQEPFHMAHFTVMYMHYVLVKVTTDKGIIGYGEATPAWEVNGENYDSIVGFINLIKNKSITGYTLLGENVNTLGQVESLIDTVINPINSAPLIAGNSSAKAALEQAIYYAFCEYNKKSFMQLYGIINTPIPCSTTISIADISTTIQQIKVALRNKPTVIRLKIGKRNVDGPLFNRDIAVIHEARNLISTKNRKIKLAADANQGFETVKEAVEFCKEIEGKLDWLEQPLPADNLLGFLTIKKECRTPLMADESITSYKDAQVLLKLGGIDYFNIKLMKVGGIRGALKVIDLAKQHKVSSYIGSMIETELGISMGCLTYLLRPEVVGTDLNVYCLLNGQIAQGLHQNINNTELNIKYPLGVVVKPSATKKYQF